MIDLAQTLETFPPQVVRLARVASLAARLEPRLLRRLRREFVPESDAGLEADLCFSPLARSHNASSTVLRTEFIELLREQFTTATNPKEAAANRRQLDRARKIIKAEHQSAPSVIRLEEKVTWLALQGETAAEQLEAELMQAVRTLTEEDRPGMAQWVARALPRLPPRARQTKAAWLLALGAAARLGGREILGEEEAVEVAPELLRAVLPRETQTAQIGVRLLADGIEFGDLRLPGAKVLRVPNVSPVDLGVQWGFEGASADEALQQTRAVFGLGSRKAFFAPVPIGVHDLGRRRPPPGTNESTVRFWEPQSGKLLRTLEGHRESIKSVAFAPDGYMLASGSEDKTVKLWEPQSGKLLRILEGHTHSITSAAFAPDGRTLVSGSDDKTVKLWEPQSGKLLRTLEGHRESIKSVAFAPDGYMLASGSEDKTVKLWEPQSGKLLRILEGHTHSITSVAFAPDGRTLVSGSDDKTVKLWEPQSGKLLRTLEGHRESIKSIAFAPSGYMLASGSEDKTVKLWEPQSGKLLRTLEGHTHSVTSVAFAPNGGTLASGSDDKTVKLWEPERGTLLRTFEGTQSKVLCVAFSKDGGILAGGSSGETAVPARVSEIRIATALGELHILRPVQISTMLSESEKALRRRFTTPGPKRILAIDSGGMRCTIALQFLAGIEKLLRERFGNPELRLADYFDLIGGTSTGGLFAAVLAMGASVAELSEKWERLSPRFFSKTSLIQQVLNKFGDDKRFNEALAAMVGNDTLTSSPRTGLCLLAKRADTGAIYSLLNHPDDRDFAQYGTVLLRDALRASMAAPAYFAPVPLELAPGESGIFMDSGASMMADPALHLLLVARLRSRPFRWVAGKEKLLLVSVGSGSRNNPPSVESAQNLNLVSWTSLIPTTLLQNGIAQTQRLLHWLAQKPHTVVSEAAGNLQTPGGEAQMTYVRYDVPLDSESLSKLGLSELASRADSLQAIDDPERLADFIAVGRTAADVQVKPSNFPNSFDVKFEAVESRREKMAEVFICYAREDKDFVHRLNESLKSRGREAWVDWEDIRPTEEFMQAIYGAIEAAETFVFVLTPNSIASTLCGREIAHATAHNKRIVPIVARDVNADTVPEPLGKLNWIFCRDGDDFEKAIDAVIRALDTDLNRVRAHRIIGNIKGRDIVEEDDGSVTFTAGAQVDGDGANGQFAEPPHYAPSSYKGKTLDLLANAGEPGNWYGVVTDTDGRPIVQGPNDPCPGAYVSATSLHLPGKDGKPLPATSPYKYVDSATVPFVAVPPMIIKGVAGVVMGCRAVVTNTKNGKSVEAVVADAGPSNKLGEISLACAKAIGVPAGEGAKYPANSGGVDAHIIHYRLFPGVPAVVNGVTYPLQHS